MTFEEALKQVEFHTKNHLTQQMSHCIDECVEAAHVLYEANKATKESNG